MKKLWLLSLLGLAVIAVAGPPAWAQDGHDLDAVSATPNTPVPAAATGDNNETACANSVQQALAGPFDLKIVDASATWFQGEVRYVFTLVGNGKRTLILVCRRD